MPNPSWTHHPSYLMQPSVSVHTWARAKEAVRCKEKQWHLTIDDVGVSSGSVPCATRRRPSVRMAEHLFLLHSRVAARLAAPRIWKRLSAAALVGVNPRGLAGCASEPCPLLLPPGFRAAASDGSAHFSAAGLRDGTSYPATGAPVPQQHRHGKAGCSDFRLGASEEYLRGALRRRSLCVRVSVPSVSWKARSE